MGVTPKGKIATLKGNKLRRELKVFLHIAFPFN